MQEGQNWEALRGAVNDKLGNLVVIVDNNKLQSDTLVKNVSDLEIYLKDLNLQVG